jgi:hypothetical protein
MNKETRNKSQMGGLPCLMQTWFEKLLLSRYFLAFIFFGMVAQGLISIAMVDE